MSISYPSRYAVARRIDWREGPVADAPGAIVVSETELYSLVEEMTGRTALRTPSVKAKLSNDGRVYIAPRSRRLWAGVVIEKMPAIS